ncbi:MULTISPECIES: hypothetical protein [Holdemania]|uniref:Uncharacterized protein n=1 Tax=Holdemania massiliensis TaxID=1468449 RepID=A0A6N7SC51_9FIRM|nr:MULTISPECIES: hypothetical protein [Holdemania]MSA73013.1 hypothetical protein [Holdemania massiliensis]MSA91210.1 hypothetical protein [Holdemania massiliensis]MSB80066.1 hypothetical protein [Holdemania massiliensis]MSC34987.1 hypothetical protein [Holdemania massiliensis]MSC41376.1 hypothetical protein [Holdemania massiliensis]
MLRIPSSFFTRERPVTATKVSLKDITPIKWRKEVITGTKKAVIKQSAKLK